MKYLVSKRYIQVTVGTPNMPRGDSYTPSQSSVYDEEQRTPRIAPKISDNTIAGVPNMQSPLS